MARKQTTYERLMSGKLSRKQRKDLVRRVKADDPGLEVVHPHTAGIDIGNESHFVAVAPGCDPEPVREFGCWTADLQKMAAWLKSCGVQSVVMQSTGVYWIAVYDLLEEQGFQMCLSNARDTKNLPGRKSDVQESQWLMKLHTYGLLRNSFRPPAQIRAVRAIWRLRERHVQDASREILHMQKALTSMNVQLSNVLSDVSGVTAQAIIHAILNGQRDPWELAKLRDYRIKASVAEIASSLEGRWQAEALFELQQSVDRYDFCQKQMWQCDKQLQHKLEALPDRTIAPAAEAMATSAAETGQAGGKEPVGNKRKQRKPRENQPQFDLQAELTRICGVDLSTIDGVKAMTIQTVVSEVGTDMSRWPTENHFVSWLKLAPQRPISGGKVVKGERGKTKNRASTALRLAASTLKNSQSYLGARFRQLRGRLGPGSAIKAMAAYLARLIYRMLTHGKAWVDKGTQEHESRRQHRERNNLQRRALALGLRLEPINQSST